MEKFGRYPRYYIETMGCQMNVHDSEVLAGHLEKLGCQETLSMEDADIYILNTCAVRKKAEEKVYSKLGKLKPLKDRKKEMLMILWGCLSQQEKTAQAMKTRFPFLDIIGGTHSLGRFPELLEKADSSKETILDLEEGAERENLPIKRGHSFKAWLPISFGCNNFCTYCVVPFVRGPEQSRPPDIILQQAENLARSGYKEITLLGQNVNSYGKDLETEIDFAKLLARLDPIPGLVMIRFMTSHPRDFSRELISVIQRGENICEHIHLPLQAGSNRILERMNRGYTKEAYTALVQAIRENIPGVSITTDLIVGFPGESEEDFQDTLNLVNTRRFDAAFTFIYSTRKGTKAAAMEGQIDPEIKKKRIMMLNERQNRISLETNQRLIGTRQSVLVEGTSKTDPQMFTGRTRTNKLVHFPADNDVLGKIIEVAITEAGAWSLKGAYRQIISHCL